MRKIAVIMVLGLALLLMGLTLSASAVTILDNSNPGSEQDLYQVFNTWLGTAFTSSGTGVNGTPSGSVYLQNTYAPLASGTLSTDAGAGLTWVYSLSGAYATWAEISPSNPALIRRGLRRQPCLRLLGCSPRPLMRIITLPSVE